MFDSIISAKIPIQGVGKAIIAAGHGTVTLNSSIGSTIIPITLNDVIYAPTAPNCLLSIGHVEKSGAKIEFTAGRCSVVKNGNVVLSGKLENNVYRLDA